MPDSPRLGSLTLSPPAKNHLPTPLYCYCLHLKIKAPFEGTGVHYVNITSLGHVVTALLIPRKPRGVNLHQIHLLMLVTFVFLVQNHIYFLTFPNFW